MTRALSDYGITKTLVRNALKKASKILKEIDKIATLSEKTKSEIVSGVLEQYLAQSLTRKMGFPVQSPSADADPDLSYTRWRKNKSVEIKVAFGLNGSNPWRGGKYSKRDAPHLLVARNSDLSEIYVVFLNVLISHWIPPSNPNYYAHTYSKKELITRAHKNELFGAVGYRLNKKGVRTKNNQISMEFESL